MFRLWHERQTLCKAEKQRYMTIDLNIELWHFLFDVSYSLAILRVEHLKGMNDYNILSLKNRFLLETEIIALMHFN